MPVPIQITELESLCRLLRITDDDDVDFMIRTVIELDDLIKEDAIKKRENADKKRERSGSGKTR